MYGWSMSKTGIIKKYKIGHLDMVRRGYNTHIAHRRETGRTDRENGPRGRTARTDRKNGPRGQDAGADHENGPENRFPGGEKNKGVPI